MSAFDPPAELPWKEAVDVTIRSVLLGLVAALLMAVGGQYVNKYVPGVKGLVRGHLPVSVFGLFIVFVMGLNPLLGKSDDLFG